MRKLFKDNSGVSLIIAIIFVSAFMLVIAGLAQAQLSTIRSIGNREAAAKVRYLADGGIELASYWAETNGVGASSAEATDLLIYNTMLLNAASALGLENCADIDSNSDNGQQPCVGFEVYGRAAAGNGIRIFAMPPDYFSAPSKGTGNAGSCADSSNADEACNWNRLSLGEAVEIPLYYEMPDGSVSAHDFSAGGKEFKLRVRAPCGNFAEPEFTGNCDAANPRVTLYPPVANVASFPESAYRRVEDAPGISSDPVLVQWSISDFGGAGTSTLLARDNTVTDPPGSGIKRRTIATANPISPYRNQNTEISAGRINLAKSGTGPDDPLADFTVLQYIPSGFDHDKNRGMDLNKNIREIGLYISDFLNPVLRLSLVGQPQKDDENLLLAQDINNSNLNIPYLEYQVLTNGIEISDSKSFIRAWAQVGDFRKEFRKELKREATLGGFVIEQF